MPTYVVLYQFTNQGIQNIKELPQGIEQAHQAIADLGGKVLACYLLMGEYDSVGIYELPSDEAAMSFLFGMGASGVARTTTLKAFTPEAVAEIVKGLP